MEKIAGLKEYVAWKPYREALGLPEEVTETYEMLAQGEYNRNYVFTHPVSRKKLVFRVNCGSQMHLSNQIQYEYDALKLLEHSGRTPRPLYVDGSLKKLPHGIMVMEFLPGHELNYRRELSFAAGCLADIHSVPVGENTHLIRPADPLRAILEECEEMGKVYMDSELGDERTKKKIRGLLDRGWDLWKAEMSRAEASVPGKTGKERYGGYKCCINTELNSTNFLINGEGKGNYLIDWEKPIYGDPAQDLGHFLAPTTTFWKTDVILTPEETEDFISLYLRAVDGRFDTAGLRERTRTFIRITCLRGVTWCAMAWVQYQQPDKLLFNQSTFHKLKAYLDDGFLDRIGEMLDCPPVPMSAKI